MQVDDSRTITGKYVSVCMNIYMGTYYTGQKRVRCGECIGCTSSNCKSCKYCQDNPKYGGPGKLKKACIQRKCIRMQKKSDKEIRMNKATMEPGMYTDSYTMYVIFTIAR